MEQALEGSLGDFGFDAETSVDRLAAFFAVQNTYLSTFQSLGGLGLLLGTFGLATVQLRSVLERRGELALDAGHRFSPLAAGPAGDDGKLAAAGRRIGGLGVAAALVAVLPHWLAGGAAVPWRSLAGTLALVLVVGLLAGLSPSAPRCAPRCCRPCAKSEPSFAWANLGIVAKLVLHRGFGWILGCHCWLAQQCGDR